jgi:hypothetical protein
MIGLPEADTPKLNFGQDEFECLNLNITRPGSLSPLSKVPVVLWIHGYVHPYVQLQVILIGLEVAVTGALVPTGCTMAEHSFGRVWPSENRSLW